MYQVKHTAVFASLNMTIWFSTSTDICHKSKRFISAIQSENVTLNNSGWKQNINKLSCIEKPKWLHHSNAWWRHQMEAFSALLAICAPHKGQWRGALVFTLICVWINGWVNNREAGDLRRNHAHYDVTVMEEWFTPKLHYVHSVFTTPTWSEIYKNT